jgi:hypothetical protein
MLNGEEGLRALTTSGEQLADGWYYYGEDEETHHGPFDSRQDAERAGRGPSASLTTSDSILT